MKLCTHKLIAFSILVSPTALMAQTVQTETADTIIVIGKAKGYATKNSFTATKTDTPILEIPQSINVISRAQIEDQSHRSIGDVLHYTAGVTVGQGEGNRDQITMRGQNTSADFFLDGVRDDVQYYRNLYNIERVEVLKGPYSMIFGRGGGGGIINRVQKAPIATRPFFTTSLSANSFGVYDIEIDINRPISADGALRFNAFYEELKSHRDNSGGQRFAANPYYAYKFNENWVGAFSYEYVSDDRVADRGIPSLNAKPLEGNRDTFFGVPGVNNTTLEAQISKLRLDGKINDTLTTTTTIVFGDYDKSYANVFPNGSVSAQNGTFALGAYADATIRNNFIFQSNLTWDFNIADIENKVLFGIEYGAQTTKNQRQNGTLSRNTFDLANRVYPNVVFNSLSRNTKSEVNFAAFYAQNQISINQNFDLILGLRFDSFDISGFDLITTPARRFGRKDEVVSPRIGLLYKSNANLNFYSSFSKSFLPRSGDQFTTLSISQQNLAPEVFTNYEIGAKWEMRPNLSLTGAIFMLNKTNATTPDPVNPLVTINIGETNTKGAEVAITGQINDAWQISGGYSYQDATLKGNRAIKLAQVPQNQFSLWSRYDISKSFGFGLGITHQSQQYAAILTAPNTTELPAFTRLDGAFFYRFSNGVKVQLNIENLLNTEYFIDAHNNNNISTGAPINARFSVSKKF